MNFLGYWPNAFIISKKNCSSFFELFKNEAVLWLWYVPIYFQTFNFFIFDYILL
jgi:hypothetical protein